MELHQLRYFMAVARSGNFTRAAANAHIAQPSLSQQILKLEDELGARLFDRLGRTARLTPFGRAFLPRAETILREVGDAKVQIQDMAATERGRVVLGVIPTIAPYFLPPLLALFSRRHPQIAVSVVEETTPSLVEQLRAGGPGLALLALPIGGREFISKELFREPLYAAVPDSHPLSKRGKVGLRQIEGESFMLLKEGHCFRESALSACRRVRINPRVVFESGQFSSVLAMVAAGAGISLVPRMAAEKRRGVRYIPLSDEGAFRTVGIVRLRQHSPSRAEQALTDHLRAGC
jgi:LysR family transcriptional regulator, hydrogen peroxide-inducible genes activator